MNKKKITQVRSVAIKKTQLHELIWGDFGGFRIEGKDASVYIKGTSRKSPQVYLYIEWKTVDELPQPTGKE